MVHARLICSGEDCPAVFEAYGPVADVEALACDCGCALEVVAWPAPVGGRVEPLVLVELA